MHNLGTDSRGNGADGVDGGRSFGVMYPTRMGIDLPDCTSLSIPLSLKQNL